MGGLEPPTPAFGGQCSIQLSYMDVVFGLRLVLSAMVLVHGPIGLRYEACVQTNQGVACGVT